MERSHSPEPYLSPDPTHRPPSPAPSRLSVESAVSPHSLNDYDAPRPTPLQATRAIKIEVHRKLTWWDVASLIINKMIGTGIFTGPPMILLYTGKKSSALWIWAGGFVYILISMTLYLEFSRKLPYTGGELVYLDEILPKPALLSYTCYALYFVCIYTTATNSMQFARQVIIAATSDTDIHDQRVMRFIAVVISTVICLLLYFSTATGRRLNRYLAWLKIGLMISVFMAGAIKAGKAPAHDINASPSLRGHSSSATALLQVLFSFQGWENATLVAGEIPDHQTLRKGFIRAVWIVGVLYILINIVYCYAIPWEPDGTMVLQYVPLFFGNSDRAKQAWAILTAFSAVGSMISVTYTCVRVKQTIAWANILPWSSFWRTSAPVRSKEPKDAIEMQGLLSQTTGDDGESIPTLRTGAPQGGIALHWLACVFYISVSSVISEVTEAILFSGLLLTYGHAIVGTVIGLFFPKSKKVEYELPPERGWEPGELSWWLRPRLCQYLFGWVYAAGSIILLVLTCIGPYENADGSTRIVKGWYFPVITFGFLALSIAYYFAFLASEDTTGVHLAGVNLRRHQHGVGDNDKIMRQCDFCVNYDPGVPHRHARDGYLHYNELNFPHKDKGRNLLYWALGGPKERHRPDLRLDDYVIKVKDGITNAFGSIWAPIRGFIPGIKSSGRW